MRVWALLALLALAGCADDEARDAARLYEEAVNVCQRGGHAEDCRARMSDSLRLDPNQACLSAPRPSLSEANNSGSVLLPAPAAGIASSLWLTPTLACRRSRSSLSDTPPAASQSSPTPPRLAPPTLCPSATPPCLKPGRLCVALSHPRPSPLPCFLAET